MYKYVLFDLDGTLTDSKEGIIKSVAYALEQMGDRQKAVWISILSSGRRC